MVGLWLSMVPIFAFCLANFDFSSSNFVLVLCDDVCGNKTDRMTVYIRMHWAHLSFKKYNPICYLRLTVLRAWWLANWLCHMCITIVWSYVIAVKLCFCIANNQFSCCSEGGFFNAIMSFPENYPNSPPTVRFTSEMWHPNGEYFGS